jgi:hypothetical protein
VRKQALRAVAASAVAAAGVTAAGSLADGASATTYPSPAAWAALRNCESGGDYAIDTGNGYYGAYQFSLQTWEGLGYGGLPSQASPATQDQAAQELYSEDGAAPWPVCGAYLSSGGSEAAPAATTSSSGAAEEQAPAPASTSTASVPAAQPAGGSTPDGAGGTLYVVQPGDTLWLLSLRFGTTVDTLASVNHIADPNLIFVGQSLIV